MEFINQSGLDFTDISSEEFREYRYLQDGGGTGIVYIQKPLRLHVSDSGGHRVFDAQGYSHYVKPGWHHLLWKAKDGHPHFVK